MAKKVEGAPKTRFKAERVKNAKEVSGAALRAIRKQSGRDMDNMCQPNSGVNDSPKK